MGTRTQSAPGAPGDALAISPDVWIGKGDYPRSAAMRGHQGQVIFAVEVSSRGEVRGCTITVSSGFESLDRRTCQVVMRNASFLPASDGAGGPRDGRYLGQFLWRLADGTPLPARTRPLVLLH
jgi:TonB family protein